MPATALTVIPRNIPDAEPVLLEQTLDANQQESTPPQGVPTNNKISDDHYKWFTSVNTIVGWDIEVSVQHSISYNNEITYGIPWIPMYQNSFYNAQPVRSLMLDGSIIKHIRSRRPLTDHMNKLMWILWSWSNQGNIAIIVIIDTLTRWMEL